MAVVFEGRWNRSKRFPSLKLLRVPRRRARHGHALLRGASDEWGVVEDVVVAIPSRRKLLFSSKDFFSKSPDFIRHNCQSFRRRSSSHSGARALALPSVPEIVSMNAAVAPVAVRPALHAQRTRLSSRGSFGCSVKVPARFQKGRSKKSNIATSAVFAAVVEPATKVTFPDTFDTHDGSVKLKCLGAGVRSKKIAIINVKIYAVALYVDVAQCQQSLRAGGSLLDGKFHKALLIQLVRNVDGKTFWEALDEALVGRIREIATNMATAEDASGNFMSAVAEAAEVAEELAMDGMADLKDLFNGSNLKKDSRVLINWKPGGDSDKTITGFDGTVEIGVVGTDTTVELKSMELARALFDVYLGDAPVSNDAKAAFEEGARRL